MNLPRLRAPLDGDDAQVLGRVLVYSLLVLWAALIIGLAVRVFLLVSALGH